MNSDSIDFKFHIAATHGNIDQVRLLVSRVSAEGEKNGFLSAAELGHVAVVNCILEQYRIDPSVDDNSAILVAAEHGHVDVVERLLRDARVDASDTTTLRFRWRQ